MEPDDEPSSPSPPLPPPLKVIYASYSENEDIWQYKFIKFLEGDIWSLIVAVFTITATVLTAYIEANTPKQIAAQMAMEAIDDDWVIWSMEEEAKEEAEYFAQFNGGICNPKTVRSALLFAPPINLP